MTDVTKIADTLNKSGQYFKVLDNTSFGFLLQKDGVYEVIGSETMEGRNYVCLKIHAFSNDNVWIAESRGEYTTKAYESGKATLSQYIDKLTEDTVKPERIVSIPPNTKVCHTLDLERVQYVGIADKDGHYLVTLGWTESVKLSDTIYPRQEFIKLWKKYHGQSV